MGFRGTGQDVKDSQQRVTWEMKGPRGVFQPRGESSSPLPKTAICQSAGLGLFCIPSRGGTRYDNKELAGVGFEWGTLFPSLFLTKLFKDGRLPGEASGTDPRGSSGRRPCLRCIHVDAGTRGQACSG